jgi:uncharacterized protein YjbJ (UPF0337 family)
LRCNIFERRQCRRWQFLGRLRFDSCSQSNHFDLKGSVKQAKGAIKEAAGKITGDAKLQAGGKADKTAGKIQNAVGSVKDALRGK